MPAGPIGSCWAEDSWLDTAWEEGSWAGAQIPIVLPEFTRVRGVHVASSVATGCVVIGSMADGLDVSLSFARGMQVRP